MYQGCYECHILDIRECECECECLKGECANAKASANVEKGQKNKYQGMFLIIDFYFFKIIQCIYIYTHNQINNKQI